MNKKLPKVFQAPINSKIKNNEEVYYSASNNKQAINQTTSDVRLLVDKLFKTIGYVFRIKLRIITTTNTFDNISLMSKTKDGVITTNNNFIPYRDIKQIIIKDR